MSAAVKRKKGSLSKVNGKQGSSLALERVFGQNNCTYRVSHIAHSHHTFYQCLCKAPVTKFLGRNQQRGRQWPANKDPDLNLVFYILKCCWYSHLAHSILKRAIC